MICPSINLFYRTPTSCFDITTYDTTTEKIKKIVTSPISQLAVGLTLGVFMHKIYGPLTEKILKCFKMTFPPFKMGLVTKILLAPFACVIAPIGEEIIFRGKLQPLLNDYFHATEGNYPLAKIVTKIKAITLTSIAFGLVHLPNLLFMKPSQVFAQVISATFAGVGLGLAKEVTGEIHMPIGMHMSNNILAWSLS